MAATAHASTAALAAMSGVAPSSRARAAARTANSVCHGEATGVDDGDIEFGKLLAGEAEAA